jgi:hypothetical protein
MNGLGRSDTCATRCPVARAGAWAVLAALCFTFLAVQNLGSWLHVVADERTADVDFVSLAVAGRLTAAAPGDVYDADAQLAVQRGYQNDGPARPFTNPPFVATAGRLLTGGGLEQGYVILAVLNVGLLVAFSVVLVRSMRALPAAPLWWRMTVVTGALASISVGAAVAEGTVSVLAALGIALFLHGRHRERELLVVGGLVLAAWKPHLAVLAVVVLLAERRWATLTRSAGVLAVMAVPSVVMPGVGAWVRYPAALLGAGRTGSAAADHSAHWWNVASLLSRTSLPAAGLATLTWVLFGAGGAALVALHRRHPDRLPLASLLLVGLVITPHANPHDALWVPLAYVLLRADGTWEDRSRRVRALLNAVALLWPVTGLLAVAYVDKGGSALTVGSMLAVAALGAMRPVRPDDFDAVPAGARVVTAVTA